MSLNIRSQKNLLIEERVVEGVDKFCYLGNMVWADEDVKSRISKARKALSQLWPVWRSREIWKGTKLRLFSSLEIQYAGDKEATGFYQ